MITLLENPFHPENPMVSEHQFALRQETHTDRRYKNLECGFWYDFARRHPHAQSIDMRMVIREITVHDVRRYLHREMYITRTMDVIPQPEFNHVSDSLTYYIMGRLGDPSESDSDSD